MFFWYSDDGLFTLWGWKPEQTLLWVILVMAFYHTDRKAANADFTTDISKQYWKWPNFCKMKREGCNMSSETIKHRLWLWSQKGWLIKKWSMLKELNSRCGWSTPTNRGKSQYRGRNWNCKRRTSGLPPTQIKKIEAEMRVLRGNGQLCHWHRERRKAVKGCVQCFMNIYISISTSKCWELQQIIYKAAVF